MLREMGRAINKTETKREESKRERETSGRKDGSRFTRITQHLSRELALTLYISLSFIENISKNDASDTYIYIYNENHRNLPSRTISSHVY